MIAFCGVYTRQNCEFNKREFSRIFPLAGGILPFQNGNSRWPWSTVGSRQSTSLATATTITVQDWSRPYRLSRTPTPSACTVCQMTQKAPPRAHPTSLAPFSPDLRKSYGSPWPGWGVQTSGPPSASYVPTINNR